jgi:hypothetical protein
LILFHQRICGPLVHSLFHHRYPSALRHLEGQPVGVTAAVALK